MSLACNGGMCLKDMGQDDYSWDEPSLSLLGVLSDQFRGWCGETGCSVMVAPTEKREKTCRVHRPLLLHFVLAGL